MAAANRLVLTKGWYCRFSNLGRLKKIRSYFFGFEKIPVGKLQLNERSRNLQDFGCEISSTAAQFERIWDLPVIGGHKQSADYK